ncbi:hypothetical protein [Arthrobacter sp. RCC_34]
MTSRIGRRSRIEWGIRRRWFPGSTRDSGTKSTGTPNPSTEVRRRSGLV